MRLIIHEEQSYGRWKQWVLATYQLKNDKYWQPKNHLQPAMTVIYL